MNLQVWWKGKALRRQFCPFKNQQGKKVFPNIKAAYWLIPKHCSVCSLIFFSDALERMQPNMSVLMVECQMRDGSRGLCWNVTAPCRLEAEVWLCKKELHGGLCTEVTGSRQQVHNTVHAGWSATRNGHWVKTWKSTCHTTLLKYVLLHCTVRVNQLQ